MMAKTDLIFPVFSLKFVNLQFNSAFVVSFHSTRKAFKSSLTVVIFLDQSKLFATIYGGNSSMKKDLSVVVCFFNNNKEQHKTQKEIKECQQNEIDEMKSELAALQDLLAKEREKITVLENYTRRENFKFMIFPNAKVRTAKNFY